MNDISYHVTHAPFGAFSSFTCGYAVSWDPSPAPHAGGFGASLRHPANQSVFAGWRRGGGPWNLLPFVRPRADRSADFTGEGEAAGAPPPAFRVAGPDTVSRRLGLASDSWTTGPFALSVLSPFERIAEWESLGEDLRRRLCAPVIPVRCAADNTAGTEDLEILFGIGGAERGLRYLGDTDPSLVGFACATEYGFAALPQPGLRAQSGLDLFSRSRHDDRGLHLLGGEAALILRVAPGESAHLDLVLGFHQQGTVTTGIAGSYYYTRYFSDLDSVLAFGLEHHAAYLRAAAARDAELEKSPLSPSQRWLVAHSVHTYLASTQLLQREGKPLWVVNEGEYRMINTFDLAVDHLFFEMSWWPWAVRSTLDLYASDYSYVDTLHGPGGAKAQGGLAFTHDMGVDNQFSAKGRSSYELPHLADCFSHMSAEQLVNWVCCAVTYAEGARDHAWLERRTHLLQRCAESLRQRDDPQPGRRTGVLKWDSDRCGPDGSEITTYDSLDVSLGQARNNLYLAVKTTAAWMLLSRAFSSLWLVDDAAAAFDTACRTATTIMGFRETGTGLFPAVFEGGNRSRILPSIEGLVFPLYLGMDAELRQLDLRTGLVTALGTHLGRILERGVCLDPVSGGWKLSSTSNNTWLSKIFLCQHVARRLYPAAMAAPERSAEDEVHRGWLVASDCRYLAFCDQLRSTDGFPFGSKHYPRGVTSWLWLHPS